MAVHKMFMQVEKQQQIRKASQHIENKQLTTRKSRKKKRKNNNSGPILVFFWS